MKLAQLLLATFALGAIAAPTPDFDDNELDSREALDDGDATELVMRYTDENDMIIRSKVCKRRYELVNDVCVRRCGRHKTRVDGVCVPGCHKSAQLVDDKCVCPEGEHYTKRYGCTE